ncbi:MAG: hypothetical protein HRU09_12165 [Oligoflexales bacterium]|nr:hypothetical protein [Oligoflexales bacterium]
MFAVNKQTSQVIFIIFALILESGIALAKISNPASYDRLKQQTTHQVRNKVVPLLDQYCGNSCQIIDIDVLIDEKVPEVEDLGFESTVEANKNQEYFVENVTLNVQVDQRITQSNIEKLRAILKNHLKHVGLAVQVNLIAVDLPSINQTASMGEVLRRKVQRQGESAVKKVIQKYCPDQCILSDVKVLGNLVTPDEAKRYDPAEVVNTESNHTFMLLEQVRVLMAIDEKMDEVERENILEVLRAKTRFVRPVEIESTITAFPQSFEEKKRQKNLEAEDPYGLEKLRRMLTLFRDLAGTKEIISNTQSSDRSTSQSSSAFDSQNQSSEEGNWFVYVMVLLIVAGLIFFVIARFNKASQDAKVMMAGMDQGEGGGRAGSAQGGELAQRGGQAGGADFGSKEMQDKLKLQELKDELIKIFMNASKVAKETFSRILQEDGVEETAKYVYIFGKIVIFELLSDPNLQKSLYELSEYYHKSKFDFDIEQEISLLQALKTKVTANEIRVLAKKNIDQFDFLLNDAQQIFELMADEKAQVQSIILTQVSPKKRRAVFDMFEGKAKVDLMNELCKADAIPREFLYNVALALSKKVLSKPEFDTQSLRASDIILELLEKSSLAEQKVLMRSLNQSNAEAAKAIKLKLVTIETLPYLKDGHLLEMVLGLERESLLNFLGGAPEHIKNLLLSHAPEELTESWMEDLANIVSVEDAAYRREEIKIIGKIRHLASNGAISLLEINELIFANLGDPDPSSESEGASIQSKNLVA